MTSTSPPTPSPTGGRRWPTAVDVLTATTQPAPRTPHRPPLPEWLTSTTAADRATPTPVTMDELTARAAAATAAQRDQIAEAADLALQELANQLQAQVSAHVSSFDRQCSGELRSTRSSIETELAAIEQASRATRRRVRRAMIWPPIASLLASMLIVLVGMWIGQHRAAGLPATTMTTHSGKTMLVLTQSGWTTCSWAVSSSPADASTNPSRGTR